MTRDDIIKMAKKAKLPYEYDTGRVVYLTELERFAALVAAAEREKVAAWMMGRGYATGHGDSTENLLHELEWQIAENWNRALSNGITTEREACAKVAEQWPYEDERMFSIAQAIRARGEQ